MMRITLQSSPVRLLAALLMLAALVVVLRPAFAQGHSPLVPNIEPAEAGLAVASPPSEAEAVAAALAAFATLPQPALPPEGALLDLPADTMMSAAALSAASSIYLPLISRPRDSGSAPTPVTPTPVTPTPVTPTPEPDKPANIAVVLWAKPSIWVARGALLEYEIRVINDGRGGTDGIDVVLPYYREQYTLEYTSLDSKRGDWVSRIDQNSFSVHFGPLDNGARRSGKLFLRVNASLPYQTILNVRAAYSWAGDGSDNSRPSNWAPVLVGSGPSDAPYVWVAASPDRGPAGTTHSFFSNRFLPGEVVSTWLNTPQGVRSLSLHGSADTQGSLTLHYTSTGLAKGNYQIVLYGNRSGLTGVASFIVQ